MSCLHSTLLIQLEVGSEMGKDKEATDVRISLKCVFPLRWTESTEALSL